MVGFRVEDCLENSVTSSSEDVATSYECKAVSRDDTTVIVFERDGKIFEVREIGAK